MKNNLLLTRISIFAVCCLLMSTLTGYSQILPLQTFTNSSDFSTSSAAPTNEYWSPASCTTGGLQYFSTGGCTGGYIGYTGSFTNYFGCFLRTPQANCTGNEYVTLNFDLSNSYIPSHIVSQPSSSDAIGFNMWVDAGYQNATSITINGVEVGKSDLNGLWLVFDTLRTCVNVNVIYSLSAYTDLSNILFYFNATDPYNDGNTYNVGIDNVSMQGGAATGVNNLALNITWQAYPNPFSNTITLHSSNIKENTVAMLYDVLGREVIRTIIPSGTSETKIDLPEGTPNGFYSLALIAPDGTVTTRKLLKAGY
jgi:hypothetical protein